jgi:hypothetical protein
VLFGGDLMNRITVGRTRLGRGRLHEQGEPSSDPYRLHALRYSVFIPRALAPSDDDERDLKALLRREAPAGTVGTVHRFEARTIVGQQATVGVDAVVGDLPDGRLANSSEPEPNGWANRLNHDFVLGGRRRDASPSDRSRPTATVAPLPWRLV